MEYVTSETGEADLQIVQSQVEELILQAPHDRGGQALQRELHVGALPPHHLHHPLEAHQHLPYTIIVSLVFFSQ